MNTYNRVLRVGLLTFGMLAVVSGATNATAQTVTPEETVRSVRKMLERLPYYGVFDSIVFRIDREVRAREVTGVFEVENSLTVARQERSAR